MKFRRNTTGSGVADLSELEAQLSTPDSIVVDDPPAELKAAFMALSQGDPSQIRHLLDHTRDTGDWDRRDTYVSKLAEYSEYAPYWLDDWKAQSPLDPDVLLIRANLTVIRAWTVRTSADASLVSAAQFRGFFSLLNDALPLIRAAVKANPADPVPWRVALIHALGVHAHEDEFLRLLTEALARAPHHMGSHRIALQYECTKWYGTHDRMFQFAGHACISSPASSLLQLLPLQAAFEYLVAVGPKEALSSRGAAIDDAIGRATEWLSNHDDSSFDAAQGRNLLALLLVTSGRHAEAYEQFRLIGAYATDLPWGMLDRDPRQKFLAMRRECVAAYAAETG